MPGPAQWAAFAVASLLFIQLPGPSLLFAIGRALTVSRGAALLSVLGNGVGVAAQALIVAIGLGAVVATSTHVYTAVKLVGAAYVVWLGVRAIRHRSEARVALEAGAEVVTDARKAVTTGLVVGLTNPKTAVFFVAFLPQFTEPGARVGPQVAVLGVAFGALAVCSDGLWTLVAARARRWFERHPRRLDTVGATGGALMIGVGATMAASNA